MDGLERTVGTNGDQLQQSVANRATAADLWQFCLKHYSIQEVKHACLKLQDQHQGNVNLALMLAWLESLGYSLLPDDLNTLKQALVRSEHLLVSYRQLRRDLKERVGSGQYKKLLNFELMLEKQQQQDLVAALNQLPWQPHPPSVLEYYCRQLKPSAQSLYPVLRVNR